MKQKLKQRKGKSIVDRIWVRQSWERRIKVVTENLRNKNIPSTLSGSWGPTEASPTTFTNAGPVEDITERHCSTELWSERLMAGASRRHFALWASTLEKYVPAPPSTTSKPPRPTNTSMARAIKNLPPQNQNPILIKARHSREFLTSKVGLKAYFCTILHYQLYHDCLNSLLTDEHGLLINGFTHKKRASSAIYQNVLQRKLWTYKLAPFKKNRYISFDSWAFLFDAKRCLDCLKSGLATTTYTVMVGSLQALTEVHFS